MTSSQLHLSTLVLGHLDNTAYYQPIPGRLHRSPTTGQVHALLTVLSFLTYDDSNIVSNQSLMSENIPKKYPSSSTYNNPAASLSTRFRGRLEQSRVCTVADTSVDIVFGSSGDVQDSDMDSWTNYVELSHSNNLV